MVNEGEVTGVWMFRPWARPRVRVVLPVPTSPINSKTTGVSRFSASWAPKESIACSDLRMIFSILHIIAYNLYNFNFQTHPE